MSVLDQENAQSLVLFNTVQSKSVLNTAMENPYSTNDNELILKFGLSLKSIKNHLESLNIAIGKEALLSVPQINESLHK